MTLAHHGATQHDERCSGETELVCSQQRRHDHVTSGAQLPVHLQHDARAQVVEYERLVRFGDP